MESQDVEQRAPRIRRELAREISTDRVGVVMDTFTTGKPGREVTQYALRPENGGIEWSVAGDDIELLGLEGADERG